MFLKRNMCRHKRHRTRRPPTNQGERFLQEAALLPLTLDFPASKTVKKYLYMSVTEPLRPWFFFNGNSSKLMHLQRNLSTGASLILPHCQCYGLLGSRQQRLTMVTNDWKVNTLPQCAELHLPGTEHHSEQPFLPVCPLHHTVLPFLVVCTVNCNLELSCLLSIFPSKGPSSTRTGTLSNLFLSVSPMSCLILDTEE